MERQAPAWWERSWAIAALALLSVVPLVWPDIPPLLDLPGHMGRYRVQIAGSESPFLAQYFEFHWALIGNLGVDLLIIPLSKLMGLEAAVKLVVIAIPALTVTGFLLVAREIHGRVPVTALFAVPLAYNAAFLSGFVNFALSMALAFLGFALWLRLGRLGRFGLRAALFVPLSMLVWVCHAFGWGVLGLMAFAAELAREREGGRNFFLSGWRAGLHCLPLAPPLILMLAWRSGHGAGETGDWFNLPAKLRWVVMAFRDRWMAFDVTALCLIAFVVMVGLRQGRARYSSGLVIAALLLAIAFLLLPRIIFGSAYADMRLVPYTLVVALLAIGPGIGGRREAVIALAALAFILVRTGGTTASLWLYGRDQARHLQALDKVERGAKIAVLVKRRCGLAWYQPRLDHLPAIATVRKHAFVNTQWDVAGAELMRPVAGRGTPFNADPSQFVLEDGCDGEGPFLLERIAEVPRERFDYVWLLDFAPRTLPAFPGLKPAYADESSILYRTEP